MCYFSRDHEDEKKTLSKDFFRILISLTGLSAIFFGAILYFKLSLLIKIKYQLATQFHSPNHVRIDLTKQRSTCDQKSSDYALYGLW